MSQSFTPAAAAERKAQADSGLPIHPAPLPTPLQVATGGRRSDGPFTFAELTAAVKHDIGELLGIGDEDLAGIVESTLVQLGHGLKAFLGADLGYAGAIKLDLDYRFVFTPFQGGTDDGTE